MDGLTDKAIAQNIGISLVTFYDWVNKYPKFAKSLRIGKDTADAVVESKLFELAKDGNFPAIKYWLTCRKPEKWSENVVIQKTQDVIFDTEDTSETDELIYGSD